jgi:uncharacterized protein YdhG (YjbR/CyaY superfamily)
MLMVSLYSAHVNNLLLSWLISLKISCIIDGVQKRSLKTANVDEFISAYPKNVQATLQALRQVIHEAAPEAGEKISYGIPTFTFHGNLVHFSAYEKHIGFYPGSAAIEAFKNKLKLYETSKGTVRFSIDKPMPLDLIREIVKFRVEQNSSKR